MTMRMFLFLIIVLAAMQNVTVSAQELQATVNVNMQTLTQDQRQDMMTMARDVENYLNSNRYLNRDWDGERIPVDVTIYVNARNGNRVSGRLSVVSKRLVNNAVGTGSGLLRIFDQDWSFEWSFSPTLVYQPLRYDAFTSVLDYYMLVAIGLDMDTYEDLAGTEAYKIAQQIAQNGNAQGVGQFSTVYQPGQLTRMSLITELMDMRFQPLRRLIYDYHDAMDTYDTDKVKGLADLEVVIRDLSDYKKNKLSSRSVLMQVFFDAKAMEIAGMFKGVKSPGLWGDLRFLDPGNTQLYEAAQQGK
ncbi:MAG: DUF4835 family protein [Ignavibacteria bacterium]|nr:DUF4835 family protein [Ignavibacteria bacterium]